MKKTKKMNRGGDMLAMLSPAASLVQSMQAGKPVGLANLSPIAHVMGRGRGTPEEEAAAASRGMKKGGKVRGDGVCQRGKTKGRMV